MVVPGKRSREDRARVVWSGRAELSDEPPYRQEGVEGMDLSAANDFLERQESSANGERLKLRRDGVRRFTASARRSRALDQDCGPVPQHLANLVEDRSDARLAGHANEWRNEWTELDPSSPPLELRDGECHVAFEVVAIEEQPRVGFDVGDEARLVTLSSVLVRSRLRGRGAIAKRFRGPWRIGGVRGPRGEPGHGEVHREALLLLELLELQGVALRLRVILFVEVEFQAIVRASLNDE